MIQSDDIACRIFGNEKSLFLEESIISCLPISSDVAFCTLGDDNPSMVNVRRLKRDVPTIFCGDVYSAILDLAKLESWVLLLNAGEIIHEDSSHFLWDFVKNHGENYDYLYMPIYDCAGKFMEEELRGISPRMLRKLDFRRDCINVPDGVNLCPSGLFPRATVRVYNGYDVPPGSPSILNRFQGRKSHCLRYIT